MVTLADKAINRKKAIRGRNYTSYGNKIETRHTNPFSTPFPHHQNHKFIKETEQKETKQKREEWQKNTKTRDFVHSMKRHKSKYMSTEVLQNSEKYR